jgi:hypothetical protein
MERNNTHGGNDKCIKHSGRETCMEVALRKRRHTYEDNITDNFTAIRCEAADTTELA